jgi:small subunit ribosomal protein S6
VRDYELTFVVRPDVDDKQTQAAASRVESLITSRGGELTNVQNWGKRRLAYPIGHHAEGSYFVYRVRMEPESQAEVEHELNLDEQVLRFISLYLDPVALEALKNPPPPMAPREPRRLREEPAAAPAEAAPAEAPAEAPAAEAAAAEAEAPVASEAESPAEAEAAATEEPAEAAEDGEPASA